MTPTLTVRRFVLSALLACALVPHSAWSQTPAPATPAEPLSADALEKLRKITLSSNKATNLDPPVVKMLGLGRDGEAISVKQFRAETALGLYVLTIPVKPSADEVIFSFRDLSGTTFNYLSDSKRMLRAAMVADADGSRTIANDQAADGFRNQLTAWGIVARRVKFP